MILIPFALFLLALLCLYIWLRRRAAWNLEECAEINNTMTFESAKEKARLKGHIEPHPMYHANSGIWRYKRN
jgi:hypothetical protein